jgi:serine/threonine-protein kinase
MSMTNKPQTDWLGHTIGNRYHIESLLGQGGMSTVYKATDPNLRREVAIKIIHPHLSRDPEFVRRFEQEAASIAQLRHPNIIQIYDFNHDDKVYYIVLEYIDGQDLKQRLKSSSDTGRIFNVKEAISIMASICDAVAYAHERGMIHRDLKPANVMLSARNQPVLTDFGVAKLLDGLDHTATGAIVGTAKYMSPEQAKGERPDERSDIYSLGVMLYEMIAGRPPFDGDTTVAVLMKHVNEPVPDIRQLHRNLPEEVVRILNKALAKDKRDRYQTAFQMAVALKSVQEFPARVGDTDEAARTTVASVRLQDITGAPLTATLPPPAAVPKSGSKLPLMIGGVAMALLALLGIGAFAFFSLADPQDSSAETGTTVTEASPPTAASALEAEPVTREPEASQPTVEPVGTSETEPTTEPQAEIQPETAEVEPVKTEVETATSGREGMVRVPGSTYAVGVDTGTRDHAELQQVELAPFWLDLREVTNSRYAEFLTETGNPPPSSWSGDSYPSGEDQHPVRGVTWEQAAAYCEWQSKRLPSEAEWEVAARGEDGRLYPWGDNLQAVELPRVGTYPVGTKLTNQSAFGLLDMAGNVWEWVDQPYAPLADDNFRLLRGGSNDFLKDMAFRLQGAPNIPTMVASAGIRCAADLRPDELDQEGATTRSDGIILEDSFGDPGSGWPILAEGTYLFGYHPPDYYHVEVRTAEDYTALSREPEVGDVTVETEVIVESTNTPEGDFRYGLALRRISPIEFYAFTVSPRTNKWAVLKSSASGLLTLDEGAVTSLQGLTPKVSDLLRVHAEGDQFTFSINNEVVSQVTDADFASGEVGFFVQTFAEDRAHIHFDQLLVREIDASGVSELEPEGSAEQTVTIAETGAGQEAEQDEFAGTLPPGMVKIPAGTFLMGSTTGEPDEQPEHEVTLEAFTMDIFEVSNRQYRQCVEAGGCTPPGSPDSATIKNYFNNPAYDHYPVLNVNWDQAQAYCQFYGKRLPTEAEWEFAAGGPNNLVYPWGNDFIAEITAAPVDEVLPVDAFPEAASPFGLVQMAGNAGEWVLDVFDPDFYANSPRTNPLSTSGPTDERIYRGGTFGSTNPGYYTTSRRFMDKRGAQKVWIGFRCAQDQ